MDNLSFADIKAATDNGECGSGILWILILFIVLFGGGVGGFGNKGNCVTTTDLQNGFNFNDLQDQNRDIINNIYRSSYDGISATKDLQLNMNASFAGVNEGIAGLASDLASCCCTTQRGIDGINYNGAINTASINENTTAQIQKVLDKMCQTENDNLRSRINQLEMKEALCGVVRYPNATTYNAGAWPFGQCGCSGTTF